ncbi:hypothetical protein [Ligilactobacillus acidipiscis]|uniref:Transcriptional regulator n=1 Tax=Ligilactobacillus acidipiscis TaxID=89059 RepID=A0A1K1KNR0_9LACO|nr:hypothetical protein [Ligilactobacillus acidipiscis]SFV40552.1 hypothetical protein LAC1533_1132 [Ligilactobacillus acidipiscis]
MATRDEAIQAIKRYPDYERDRRRRELELRYPFDAYSDENIGGGRAQNVRDESLENEVSRVLSDPKLIELERNKNAVERVLKQCVDKQVRSLLDRATYDIIYEFYFAEVKRYNAQAIADKVGLSRGRVYARKDAFIDEVQKELTKRDKNETKCP